MRNEDRISLQHMKDAAVEIIDYTSNFTRGDLDSNKMLLHSLVRCIEIIGEAANKTSEETQKEFSILPWPEMIGMRNRLIHAYFDINKEILWTTVTQQIPELLIQLSDILNT